MPFWNDAKDSNVIHVLHYAKRIAFTTMQLFVVFFWNSAMSDLSAPDTPPAAVNEKLADPIGLTRQLGSMVDKRLDILRRIHETGSISEAARTAGVSYKAAWQAIETLSNLAGSPLVDKAVGGVKGGGTRLTAVGLQVVDLATRLAAARAAVLADFEAEHVPELANLSASTLRTSMRNHLPAVIRKVEFGPARVRVYLEIDRENTVRATLTQESAQLMGLKVGMKVLALSKATAVEVASRITPVPGCNILRGTVVRVSRAEKGGEVTLRLAGGLSLVGFSRRNHGLRVGDTAEANLSAQSIVIGLFT